MNQVIMERIVIVEKIPCEHVHAKSLPYVMTLVLYAICDVVLILWGFIEGVLYGEYTDYPDNARMQVADHVLGLAILDLFVITIGVTGLIKQNYTMNWLFRILAIFLIFPEASFLLVHFTAIQNLSYFYILIIMVFSFFARVIALFFGRNLGDLLKEKHDHEHKHHMSLVTLNDTYDRL